MRSFVFHLLFTFGLAHLGVNVSAQCCAAGNPDCEDPYNTSGKHILNVSASYQYSLSDEYYDYGRPTDFKYMRNTFFRFTALSANYGVTDKLRLGMTLGYFVSKAQTFETGYFRESVGFGDLMINSSYRILNKEKFSLSPTLRITLPTGAFDQRYGPVILPIDLQPSAGSLRIAAGFQGQYPISSKLNFAFQTNYEVSSKIETDYTSYHYGGLTLTRLQLNYKLPKGVSAGVQTLIQVRERAKDQHMKEIRSTGGEMVFLSPSVSYSYQSWSAFLQYEVPVYRHLNGVQLNNTYRYSFRIQRRVNLSSVVRKEVAASDTVYMNVDGVCEMCKERIETTALTIKGVVYSNWDMTTRVLKLGITEDFRREDLVVALLAKGHDADGQTASDDAYNALHSCCKYRPIE